MTKLTTLTHQSAVHFTSK